MSAGVMLLTHPDVGDALIATATSILGQLPLTTETLSPAGGESLEMARQRGEVSLQRLDTGAGVLILTDAYGATPGNLAVTLGKAYHCPVVTGLNLPMLLRVMNYPQLSVEVLARKAVEAAQESILQATPADGAAKAGPAG